MDIQIAKLLAENVDGAEIYEGYSGRGMFGEQTTGVSLDGGISDVFEAIGNAIANMSRSESDWNLLQDLAEAIPSFQTDSLGKGMIVY